MIVFALFLLLALNCAYKQVRSDLVNILNTGHQMYSRWTVWYLMEIQLCASEYVSCDAGVFPYTLVETCVPSRQAQQTSFDTGQRQLIYKVQSKEEDHCFPGEWEAHGLTSAGLFVSPCWRNRNTTSAIGTAHHFPTTILIPQPHHLQWRKFLLPVSKHFCVFAANRYRFASVMLHKFLKNSPWLLSSSWQFVSII